MLRVRSGGSSEGDQPTSLSPDMERVVADAQAEMDRLVRLGNLQNDPIRHPIQALSVHLGAFHKLIEAAAHRPVSNDDVRRLTSSAGASNRASDPWRPVNRRTALIAAGTLMVAFLAGTGAGYRLRGGVPVLIGVHAGAERCEDRPDGSRLCWIPVYERSPATPSGTDHVSLQALRWPKPAERPLLLSAEQKRTGGVLPQAVVAFLGYIPERRPHETLSASQ